MSQRPALAGPPLGAGAGDLPIPASDVRNEFWWRGNLVEIRPEVSSRYLFFATETRVWVNGERVAWSGGFGLEEWAVGSFQGVDGSDHRIAVRGRIGSVVMNTLSAQVWIDGEPVDRLDLPVSRMVEGLAGSTAGAMIIGSTLLWLLGSLLRVA